MTKQTGGMTSENQTLRNGFTTGSCAAAAAKAATCMLFSQTVIREISVPTPKGIRFHAVLEEIRLEKDAVSCGVRKDGGDDPDVTSGALICAGVSYHGSGTEDAEESFALQVIIDAGEGIGTVTRPGLDRAVGEKAINRVPLQMIRDAVEDAASEAGYEGRLFVTIFVPGGEAIAKRTMNAKLGIEGGISILGTSGIVEPMSTQALKDTLFLELRQRREEGSDAVILTPGNYGRDFLMATYGCDADRSIQCSNFIGEALEDCRRLSYKRVLLAGHIGKLVKVSGGILNTHSSVADCRMELLSAAALRAGAENEVLKRILQCVTTQEALYVLKEDGCLEQTMQCLLERILTQMKRVAGEGIAIDCILFSNEEGTLAKTPGADAWFTL